MTETGLNVIFEGPGIDSGVPLEDLQKTLQHVQRAFRLMVGQLGRCRTKTGKTLGDVASVRACSDCVATYPESLVTELVLSPSNDTHRSQQQMYGQRALNRILDWQSEDESFPETVADELHAIGSDLSPGCQRGSARRPTQRPLRGVPTHGTRPAGGGST